jgi:hypothetical protein
MFEISNMRKEYRRDDLKIHDPIFTYKSYKKYTSLADKNNNIPE